jgi:hypothetical protein
MASIKRRGDVVRVQLRPEERAILAGLAGEVAQMLGGATPPDPDPLAALVGMDDEPLEQPKPPEDPAVHRLLPDAYGDAEAAAEFRRLTDAELRRGKAGGLTNLAADMHGKGTAIELSVDRADEWLAAINDIRLVLGVRLDIDDDAGDWRSVLGHDDPRQPLLAAYDWLSMLQELIVDALA